MDGRFYSRFFVVLDAGMWGRAPLYHYYLRREHVNPKHIDVRHHFIRDHVQKKDVKVQFVPTQQQLADIFTKPLGVDQFTFIRGDLGMVNPNEVWILFILLSVLKYFKQY